MSDTSLGIAIGSSFERRKRGLIVSSPITVRGNSFHGSSNLDPQELRFATLLWDKIAWPSNNAFYFTGGDDEKFLENEGVIVRPHIEYPRNINANVDVIAKAQIQVFNQLENDEPGQWSVSQGKNSLQVEGDYLITSNNAQLELYKAIPVPNEDVPLAEILEFKLRRNAEFNALQSHIDGIVSEISRSNDKEEELKKQIKLLDQACADAIRVSSEWSFPVKLINLKCNYEIRPLQTVAGAIAAYLGSGAVPMTATQTALSVIGGAAIATAPMVKMPFDGFAWKGLRSRPGPYQYACEFHKELF